LKKTLGMMILLAAIGASAEETAMTLPAVQSNQMNAMETKGDLEISDASWRFQMGQSTAEYAATAGAKGKGLTIGLGYEFSRLIGVSASFANMKNEYSVSEYDYYSETSFDSKYSENVNVYTGALEITPMRYDYKDVAFSASLLLGAISGKDTGPFYGAAMTVSLNKQIGVSLDTKVRIKTTKANSQLDALNQISLVGYY